MYLSKTGEVVQNYSWSLYNKKWLLNIEEEVYLQISVSQYRLMETYKYNITQNKT